MLWKSGTSPTPLMTISLNQHFSSIDVIPEPCYFKDDEQHHQAECEHDAEAGGDCRVRNIHLQALKLSLNDLCRLHSNCQR